jgi:hypothetical protein
MCAGLTTLPLHVPNVYKIWEPQRPGALRAWPGLACFKYQTQCVISGFHRDVDKVASGILLKSPRILELLGLLRSDDRLS